ncbi:MAG: DUF368 domain-containing protein [Microscillaceae bacterium]|nr:DUF368 domain-containing protein [Microscillaceae bacterium]
MKSTSSNNWPLLYLKGLAMGAADAVPGVSGGTVAFITGIYERLLGAIRGLNGSALRLLLKGKFSAFWQKVDGTFLVILLGGILSSLLIFSRLILYWLETVPEILWAFFFGLIVASCWLVAKGIPRWNLGTVLFLVLGTISGYLLTVLTPANTPEHLLFIFLSGAIAICAMILPGISGSFILVILGKYEFIFTALKAFQLKILLTFALGCVAGLLAFSHVVHWLLRKFHNATVAFLTGIMIGSLNKIWPWKQVLEYYTNRHGEQKPLREVNIWPGAYQELTGQAPHLWWALGFAVLGFLLVWGIEMAARQSQKVHQS